MDTFNIGTGKPINVSRLASTLIDTFGLTRDVQPIYLEPILGDIKDSDANIERATKNLKFSANQDLESGLKTYIASTVSY